MLSNEGRREWLSKLLAEIGPGVRLTIDRPIALGIFSDQASSSHDALTRFCEERNASAIPQGDEYLFVKPYFDER